MPPQWFTKGLGFPCHCFTKYQGTQQTIHMQAIFATKHYLPKLNPICLRGLNKVTSMHVWTIANVIAKLWENKEDKAHNSFSHSFGHAGHDMMLQHLHLLIKQVFSCLSEVGLKNNAKVLLCKKSYFAISEVEYLAFWITWDSIQALPKKVASCYSKNCSNHYKKTTMIIHQNFQLLSRYVGKILWSPSTTITSHIQECKVSMNWHKRTSISKDEECICWEVLLSYPDFTKPFISIPYPYQCQSLLNRCRHQSWQLPYSILQL
jgi:hypothetical protein